MYTMLLLGCNVYNVTAGVSCIECYCWGVVYKILLLGCHV